MDINEYVKIITPSIQEGYQNFSPSLCMIDGSKFEIHVLECELSHGGDKEQAYNWINSMPSWHKFDIFMSYRIPEKTIEVVKISNLEVVEKVHVAVDSYSA
jgi:hypothetical protein